MSAYRTIRDLDIKERRVFIRVDFNVPLEERDGTLVVADDSRIRGALETIRYAIEGGAKVLLGSHLGRPKGKREMKYSLEPVGQRLSELLDKEVVLTDAPVGDGSRSLSFRMKGGDVMLLENLRFDPGEESNSPEFAAQLATLCDVYVTDAFGALHRAHASTSALPKLFPERGIGMLVEKELRFLEPLRTAPEQPMGLIMGGAKVSDKIGILEAFIPKVRHVFIGGAMAYAFLKARGVSVGTSLCEDEQVKLAKRLSVLAESKRVLIHLPVDHVVAKAFKDSSTAKTTEDQEIPDGYMGLDIGPRTIEKFKRSLEPLKTIFWNGPMGVFEEPAFAQGTFELAKAIAETSALKLAGGGDVAAALAASGQSEAFDFISTGGGATLEYLEGKALPGLKAVELTKQQQEARQYAAENPV